MNEERVKEYLQSLLQKKTQDQQEVLPLVLSWEKLLAQISGLKKRNPGRHCRLTDFSCGQILIEADHPGWLQLLQIHQDELLKLVQGKFKGLKIKGIRFRLTYDSKNEKSKEICAPKPVKEPLTEEEKTQMEGILKELEAMVKKRD